MRKAKAFTLVELLVVISIIALLLSILMPALQKVRDQGRTIVCAAHIRNLFQGYLLYSSEYKDYIAPTDSLNGKKISRINFPKWMNEMGVGKVSANQNFGYRQMIVPLFFGKRPMSDIDSFAEFADYTQKKLTCPVTKGKTTITNTGMPHGYHVTYGVNGDVDGWKFMDIRKASSTVLLIDNSAEFGWVNNGIWMQAVDCYTQTVDWNTWQPARIGRWHGPKILSKAYVGADTVTAPNKQSFNVAYVDGHVKLERDETKLIWRKDGAPVDITKIPNR